MCFRHFKALIEHVKEDVHVQGSALEMFFTNWCRVLHYMDFNKVAFIVSAYIISTATANFSEFMICYNLP